MRIIIAYAMLLSAPAAAAATLSSTECATLSAEPVEAAQVLPMRKLSPTEKATLTRTRACLKTYDYPGGDKALLEASSDDIRADLNHLRDLFISSGAALAKGANDSDTMRALHIELGWSREQVLLWGNWWLLNRLDDEADYTSVLKEANRIRDEFGLKVVPLTHWDDANDATYFAPQVLRNMIAAYEYNAKGHLTAKAGPAREALIKAYRADQSALLPLMSFTGNPGVAVLGPACRPPVTR